MPAPASATFELQSSSFDFVGGILATRRIARRPVAMRDLDRRDFRCDIVAQKDCVHPLGGDEAVAFAVCQV